MPNPMRIFALATAVAAALLTAGPLSASAQSAPVPPPTRSFEPAPLYRSANALPGRYIVSVSATADPDEMLGRLGVKSQFTYTSVVRGFAAALSPAQLQAMRYTPGVVAVEEDAKVTSLESGRGRGLAPAATWGLDRIDQRALPLDSQFNVNSTGRGATAYIIDTGIDYAHAEFGGRAVPGYDVVGDGRRGQDCQGHGTHVAGTVGGATYGVAREARLVSVRVLDCLGEGTWSGVIAGFDWVATHAVQPSVLNASLGGPRSEAMNNAANAVADRGVLPVVAAGNESANACDVSPASALRAVTVGASDAQDRPSGFSNYGGCLTLFAPGTAVVSAKLGGGSVAHDGTSMAAPHVAGTALLYKAAHPAAGPMAVADWLGSLATKDVMTGVDRGSPNSLLYAGGL
ncbi:S8 family peptidase [Streptomyces sp. SYSU K217416]